MGKTSKGSRFYAVAAGKEGPKVYTSWADTENAVNGVKGALHKSFKSMEEAEAFIKNNSAGRPLNVTRLTMGNGKASQKREQSSANMDFLLNPTSYPPSCSLTSSARSSQSAPSTSSQEYKPRITTRYEPYPTAVSSTSSNSGKRVKREKPDAKMDGPQNQVYGVLPGSQSSRKPNASGLTSPTLQRVSDIRGVEALSQTSTSSPRTGSTLARATKGKIQMEMDVVNISDNSDEVEQVFPDRLSTQNNDKGKVKEQCEEAPKDAAATIPPDQKPEPPLSAEQQSILNRVLRGESLFYTGSAGVGKSVVTRAIISNLRKCFPGSFEVAVTASTGIAAINIGGSTLHSWAGVGLAKETIDILFFKILKGKQEQLEKWKKCKVLIIDEVSMIDGSLFDTLEHLGRMVRKNSQPFGGIQLVITGDFFQLPPVPDNLPSKPYEKQQKKKPMKFAFEAETWNQCIRATIVLKEVFRQKDRVFVDHLNSMRMGRMTPEAIADFQKLGRKVQYDDGIDPTYLFPLRASVKKHNTEKLATLKTQEHVFDAQDRSGRAKDGQLFFPNQTLLKNRLNTDTLVEAQMSLKEGAQVMLVKNLQNGLVNGSVGKVVGFLTKQDIEPTLNEKAAMFGMTPDQYAQFEATQYEEQANGEIKPMVKDNLGKIDIAQAALTEQDRKRLKLQPDERLSTEVPEGAAWPVVHFQSGARMLLPPLEFSIVNATGETEATRSQVPLILAWALSIHKSQGQTLERVRVDLGDSFEAGMCYVALSRATRMETLQVLRFSPARVKAHERVIEWYKTIEEQDRQRDLLWE